MIHYEADTQYHLTVKLRENTRKLFFLWEFLLSEGLQDAAREYLSEHEDEELPFELNS